MKKITPNRKEYNNEINKLKRRLLRLRKRGYNTDKLEEYISEHRKRKRITKKAIEDIKKIRGDYLYENVSYFYNNLNISGVERRAQERKETAKKAAITRKRNRKIEEKEDIYIPLKHEIDIYIPSEMEFASTIIANFFIEISKFNDFLNQTLIDWIDRLRTYKSDIEIAEMLEQGRQAGYIITYEEAYNEEKLYHYIDNMLYFLPDLTDNERADILEGSQLESYSSYD